MAKIPRKTAKIFGANAGAAPNGIGQFGSLAASAPAYSTDLDVIQSLAAWLNGMKAAIIGSDAPAIEDHNAIFYVLAHQVAYILQAGVAEYDAATTYYTNSFVNFNGLLYVSLVDSNTGNTPDVSPTQWALFVEPKTELSPTALAADTNNWAPTDFDQNVEAIYLSATLPVNVTGLVAGSNLQRVIIYNSTAFPILFKNQSTASTAGNRFKLPYNKDILVRAYQSLELYYDGTNSQWVGVNNFSATFTDPEKYRTWSFVGDDQGPQPMGIVIAPLSGGNPIGPGTDADGPAFQLLTLGSTGSLCEVINNTPGTPNDYSNNVLQEGLEFYCKFKLGQTSSFGFVAMLTTAYSPAPTDASDPFNGAKGITLWAKSGGNFLLAVSDGTVATADTGIALDTNVHEVRIVYNTGRVTLWLDGTRVTTTTHVPGAEKVKPVYAVKTSANAIKTVNVYKGHSTQPL